MEFKNSYSIIGRKDDFKIKYEEKDMTDQSQLASASITEMAKRYGIDAIMARAEQMEVNEEVKNRLYGNDYTQMFNSREELLNTKKKLNNLFENIPARIRKEVFNDEPMEFVNAYTSNDENKLDKLQKIGIISESQMEQVRAYNQNKRQIELENKKRAEFISKLEQKQGEMYETFKKTGDIAININQNSSANNSSVQNDIQ